VTGVGWPPWSEGRDSANADPFAQTGLAVAAVNRAAGAAAVCARLDPHADTTSRQAKMQPPDAAGRNVMRVGRTGTRAGSPGIRPAGFAGLLVTTRL
jgi:hypothetical protein